MLCPCRLAKLRPSPRPLLSAAARRRLRRIDLRPSISSSSPPRQVSPWPPVDKGCGGFLPWLERKAGVEISSFLSVGKSVYGRSLFASKAIRAGDSILKVPFDAEISPDDLLPEIRSFKVGTVAKLAAVVLKEQKMGPDSDWAPYIRCLPRPEEMHSTVFWSDEQLEMIKESLVYQKTIDKKVGMEREFSVLRHALDQHFPEVSKDMKFEDFMHACALVESRAWESSKGCSLIPFADFLNHDGLAKAVLLRDEQKQFSEVIADRNYAPGEQVLISYGKFSNAILVLDFGFTLPHNIHDEMFMTGDSDKQTTRKKAMGAYMNFQIQFNVPLQDPLYKMKLYLLQRHCSQITHRFGISKCSADSFTIKEVRSAKGIGTGIPQALRAAARVLSCTSLEELNDMEEEATQNDGRLGRRPLKNINREIQAHQLLLSHITKLIDQYNASAKDSKSVARLEYDMSKRYSFFIQVIVSEAYRLSCKQKRWHPQVNGM
ncbi:ribulose-1,5 bisphosphate carboxylase/oxygenase large subunit N-methyltransferase, chloroplastic isoform X2 [Syzygium oleosum]|uniref:ribulose-1,5 bisphosphate carboxylase/oxygenase large subunit N-methyltransferase, chloroplastic isoform X2 n=1 Tax=Syzygium oleosum TaxID=219896 RepID=UPI0024BACEF8|nr:ribulose-1,5 bisphosphate carboxylase/oxygenase large subunit N-methyltransferase, chloroplastic isoform X2 [Syzygium oleosum]